MQQTDGPGYADGLEFEMIVPTIPDIQQLGEIVQTQLAEVGITVNIRQVEPAQTADIDATQVAQSDEDRTALKSASAAVTDAALDVPPYVPIVPHVLTDRVIGRPTWLSGKPELRDVGLKKA